MVSNCPKNIEPHKFGLKECIHEEKKLASVPNKMLKSTSKLVEEGGGRGEEEGRGRGRGRRKRREGATL